MDDYISREAAISMPWANGQYDHEHANEHFICGLETYREWLEYVPVADVRPVVRGKWIDGKCDQCGEHAPYWCMASTYHTTNFCPNCGADMREVKADG